MKVNKIFLLVISLILTASLISYWILTKERADSFLNTQNQNLADVQTEFSNTEMALLNSKSITATEAYSLAKKYKHKMQIKIDDVILGSSEAISKENTFSKSSVWTVKVKDTTGDSVFDTIIFSSVNTSNDEPPDKAAKYDALVNLLGIESSNWSDITHDIEEFTKQKYYKLQIAALIGSNSKSDWNTLYSDLEQYILQSNTGADSRAFEQLSIDGNSSASSSVVDFSYAIVVSTSNKVLGVVQKAELDTVSFDISDEDNPIIYEDNEFKNTSSKEVIINVYGR